MVDSAGAFRVAVSVVGMRRLDRLAYFVDEVLVPPRTGCLQLDTLAVLVVEAKHLGLGRTALVAMCAGTPSVCRNEKLDVDLIIASADIGCITVIDAEALLPRHVFALFGTCHRTKDADELLSDALLARHATDKAELGLAPLERAFHESVFLERAFHESVFVKVAAGELAVGERAREEYGINPAVLELASDELATGQQSFRERAVVAEGAVLEYDILTIYKDAVVRIHRAERTVHELASVPATFMELEVSERHVLEDLLGLHCYKLSVRIPVRHANLDHFTHG